MKLVSFSILLFFSHYSYSQGYTKLLGEADSDKRFELTHKRTDSLTGWKFNYQIVFHKLHKDWDSLLIDSIKLNYNNQKILFPSKKIAITDSTFKKKYYPKLYNIDVTNNSTQLIAPRANQEFEISWDVIDTLDSPGFSIFPVRGDLSGLPRASQVLDSSVSTSFTCTFRIIAPEPGEVTIGPFSISVNNKNYTLNKLQLNIGAKLPDSNNGLWIRKVSLFDNHYLIIEQKSIAKKSAQRKLKKTQDRFPVDRGIEFTELRIEQFDTTKISIEQKAYGISFEKDELRNLIGDFDHQAEFRGKGEPKSNNIKKSKKDIGFRYTIYKFKKLTTEPIVLRGKHFINLPEEYKLDLSL